MTIQQYMRKKLNCTGIRSLGCCQSHRFIVVILDICGQSLHIFLCFMFTFKENVNNRFLEKND